MIVNDKIHHITQCQVVYIVAEIHIWSQLSIKAILNHGRIVGAAVKCEVVETTKCDIGVVHQLGAIDGDGLRGRTGRTAGVNLSQFHIP